MGDIYADFTEGVCDVRHSELSANLCDQLTFQGEVGQLALHELRIASREVSRL
jgi:hypothetical protein